MSTLHFQRLGIFGVVAYALFVTALAVQPVSYVFVSFMFVFGTGLVALLIKDLLGYKVGLPHLSLPKMRSPVHAKKEMVASKEISEVANLIRQYEEAQTPKPTVQAEKSVVQVEKLAEPLKVEVADKKDEAYDELLRVWARSPLKVEADKKENKYCDSWAAEVNETK
jgi:hypothetical protein